MNTAATRPNRLAAKSLRLRLTAQNEELTTCSTVAMARCVLEAIADTERQLGELGAAS